MPTISPQWTPPVQIEGVADAYTSLIGTTEIFSDVIDMSAHDKAHVTVDVNFGGSPVDHVDLDIYSSLDGVAFTNIGFGGTRVYNGSGGSISLLIEGVVYARIGFKQTGATDSHGVRSYVSKRNWFSS